MRRIIQLGMSLLFVGGAAAGASGCHEGLDTYTICDAFKPHATGIDYLYDYEMRFGVAFCDAIHAPLVNSHHNYCVFPDGAHWFWSQPCDGPSSLTEAEVAQMIEDGPPPGAERQQVEPAA